MNYHKFTLKQLLSRVTPFLPCVFCFGLLLATVLLLMPSYAVPKVFDFYDKAQHGLIFVALAVAGLLAYPQHIKTVVWGLVFYGGLMEVLQSLLTTTRHGDWFDWLADNVGIAMGLCAYLACQKLTKLAINKIAV
jgi:VanZ family protein